MIPKLYTSALTFIAWCLCHSGATYPLVPRIPVKVLVCMFWGFMSECMIWVTHSSCKYRSPRAMSKVIPTL
ncbi:hypothetical protein AMTRI_Chr04g251990 [Amborella trichopoda]